MSFTVLAESILQNAKTLDEYISTNKLPPPSFNVDGPARTVFTTKEAIKAHATLLGTTHRLSLLAQGPTAPWMGTMNSPYGDAMTTASIFHFRIAKHVSLDGEAPFEEVAQKAGMALRDFKMIVRFSMTNFIFHEPRPGFIAHTASSRVLKENRLIASLMGMGTDELLPALPLELTALEKHPGSQEPTESSWSIANNARAPMFQELAIHHPKRAETMAFAMETLATLASDSIVCDNYDWVTLGKATMVDVGGGKGLVCRQLAKHFPDLSFIVQDLQDTANAGRATCPAVFKDRITYMTHDFFTPQPVKDADVYFFRAIFHDWPDKYCVELLRNLIPALKNGARVIISDPHTPDPLTMEPWQERQVR